MKAIALLAACGLAVTAGCQVSGSAEVDTTQRPSARAEAVAGYSMAYEANQDTEWAASNDASAQRGTIPRGKRVMFSRAPDASLEWQQAQVDGTVRWVRPNAYRMVTTR
jgi:hypothetical protein